MTEKRFTITQKEDYFYVRDEVDKKPMGMFEFKQDEFPVYFCFHKIIDLLNEQHETIQVLEKYLDNMRCGALTDDKRIKELYGENEQLKFQLQNTSDQRDEFHRGARENANRVGKLEKENEQLKQDILRLMYTAEHLIDIKKLEEKWGIDYNQFHSDLINGDEHL